MGDPAGLLGQLSCPRQVPGDGTCVSQAAPSGVWRMETREGPGGGGKLGPLSRYPKLWVFVDVNTVVFQDICAENRAPEMSTEGQGKSFIPSLTHSHRPRALQMARGSPGRPREKGHNTIWTGSRWGSWGCQWSSGGNSRSGRSALGSARKPRVTPRGPGAEESQPPGWSQEL